MNVDLFANGLAIQRGRSLVYNLEALSRWPPWGNAELLRLKEAKDLGTLFFVPRLRVVDFLSIVEPQRIGKGIGAYLRFVVIHRNAGNDARGRFRSSPGRLGVHREYGERDNAERGGELQCHGDALRGHQKVEFVSKVKFLPCER